MGNEVSIKEYKGQRVVTFKDIDMVHSRPEGTAKRNFSGNREHFIKDVDYFKITADEFRTAIGNMDKRQQNDIILVTESGYLMLVKSFNDDLAWRVQRELVNTYFKFKSSKTVQNADECYYAKLKDLNLKWKRKIVNPLVSQLNGLLDTSNIVDTYAYIYRKMKLEYGFDMNEARDEYVKKYNLQPSDFAIIDVISDNKKLRKMFTSCVSKSIREKFKNKLDIAKLQNQLARQRLTEIKECSAQFEEELSELMTTTKCDCLK